MLEVSITSFPKIAHAIEASASALRKYMSYTRQSRVYALAMILNPSIKFQYLEQHWTAEEQTAASTWMEEAMLDFRRAERAPSIDGSNAASRGSDGVPNSRTQSCVPSRQSSASSLSSTPATHPHLLNSHASDALSKGFDAVEEAERKLLERARRHNTDASAPEQSAGGPHAAVSAPIAASETDAEREERLQAEDQAVIKLELEQYKKDALKARNINLLQYWQEHARTYPYLYRVALDILPVPASSVPCERVFSSSKETDTLRRTGLDAAMMEILQVLKYSLKQRQREYIPCDLVTRPEDLVDILASPEQTSDMLHIGNLNDLVMLFNESCPSTHVS